MISHQTKPSVRSAPECPFSTVEENESPKRAGNMSKHYREVTLGLAPTLTPVSHRGDLGHSAKEKLIKQRFFLSMCQGLHTAIEIVCKTLCGFAYFGGEGSTAFISLNKGPWLKKNEEQLCQVMGLGKRLEVNEINSKLKGTQFSIT